MNKEEAARWYRRAAEHGDEDGACCLGYLYETGVGVEQSWEEAVGWYRAAAEQGLPRAQCNLAWCYEHAGGWRRIWSRRLPGIARPQSRRTPGPLCVGRAYDYGLGVEQNAVEAVQWYRQAAESRICTGNVRSGRML